MVWRRSLLTMLVAAGVTVALVGGFNVLVDSLGIFGTKTMPGFNERKPYLSHHRELARWQRAERACAELAIFGNSRAEIGFDPESSELSRATSGAFNHAIPGKRLEQAVHQLAWLKQAGCMPKQIIVGVEYFDDLGKTNPVQTGDLPPRPRVSWGDWPQTVFSLRALGDSLRTIRMQQDPYAASITPLGFNPLKEYDAEVQLAGHYPLFRQRAVENYARWSSAGASAAFKVHQPVASHVEDLLALVEPATKVYLVVYPYHAQIRLMQEQLGLTPSFLAWKRSLAAAAQKARAQGLNVEVWDFSLLTEFTLEPIPAPGDKLTRTKWYWESGHFKKELGEKLFGRMLSGGDGTAAAWPKGWGVRLDDGEKESAISLDAVQVQDLLNQNNALASGVRNLNSKKQQMPNSPK
jgi:hypothetical protein